MSKKGDWSVPVTSELRRNMEKTARAAYENGCSLIKDAVILFEVGRFPRAAALAILAEEEFSKSFMLINCAIQSRWDSAIFNALFRHAEKQAFTESMRDFLELCDTRNKIINQINQCQLIPISFSKHPSKEKIEEVISRGKSRIKEPIKDLLKQNCFFVRCDMKATLQCKPDLIGQKEAQSCLEESEEFRKITELQYDEYSKSKFSNNSITRIV
jgi:AbiV family abortive infection protein